VAGIVCIGWLGEQIGGRTIPRIWVERELPVFCGLAGCDACGDHLVSKG